MTTSARFDVRKAVSDMHELPIVQKIVEEVFVCARREGATRVTAVYLEIGSLHDLVEEWVQKYFSFACRGSIAEGAKLNIVRTPVICRCESCSEYFTVQLYAAEDVNCPCCGSNNYKISLGNELMIQRIELELPDSQVR